MALIAAGCGGRSESTPSTSSSQAQTITAGGYHSCVVEPNGTILCWGSNLQGQLGIGVEPPEITAPAEDFAGIQTDSEIPVAVEQISDAASVAAGLFHTCALHRNGTVSCWGDNRNGQLGRSETRTEDNRLSGVPLLVSGISGAIKISAGGRNTCALLGDGSISCWGNNYAQLADGESGRDLESNDTDELEFSALPVNVSGIEDARDIAVGEYHVCAIHEDGSVSCWGRNLTGEIGSGNAGFSSYTEEPQKAEGIENATAVAAGGSHTCVIHEDGTVSCWGGTSASSVPDSLLEGVTGAIAIDAGESHTCVLREDMTLLCWGYNGSGQLGNGETFGGYSDYGASFEELVQVAGIADAAGVAAGMSHTCASHTDGTVSCWGDNWFGQIGNGEKGFGMEVPMPAKIVSTG